MSPSLPTRTRLLVAALSLSAVSLLVTLHEIVGRSSGEVAFRVACAVLALAIAFLGVFRSTQLQLLWGWALVAVVPCLIALCVFFFRGPELIGGLFATFAALVGGYLLIADTKVKDYRESLRRRKGV